VLTRLREQVGAAAANLPKLVATAESLPNRDVTRSAAP